MECEEEEEEEEEEDGAAAAVFVFVDAAARTLLFAQYLEFSSSSITPLPLPFLMPPPLL